MSGGDAETAGAYATRALVIGPYLSRPRTGDARDAAARRDAASRLEEAVGLAAAIDLLIVRELIVNLTDIRPSTYLGKGKVEELTALVTDEKIGLVIMDCALSPVQQRNLERAFSTKIIDRTGLILEIFGRRARTREGALQVELAHLDYQRSRLVRSWTHLERQRGGFGFLGGPGETQIETDRRLIDERIARIEQDLDKVRRTRSLNRKRRSDVPYPVVALVGYTNAGKSTLFNRLTHASVMAADMLFATLDPTLRIVELPHRSKVILSDTVGFISDLPTQLVTAFRATLEEVVSADIILHVRDIAHPDSRAQSEDVSAILGELGIAAAETDHIIEVWNKLDLLSPADQDERGRFAASQSGDRQPVLLSALTGQGTDVLLDRIEARLAIEKTSYRMVVEAADGPALHWLYEKSEVLARETDPDGRTHVDVRISSDQANRLLRRFPDAIALPAVTLAVE